MTGLFDSPAAYRPTPEQAAAPLPPIEAVLFDFSNTLFRMIDAETWLRRIDAAAGRGEWTDEAVADAVARLLETARDPEVVAAQVGRDLSPEKHRQAMREWWNRVELLRGIEEVAYAELRAPDAWVPYPDTAPVLEALHEAGIRIGVISDFAWDLNVHLEHFGLDGLVDSVTLSYKVGHEKPDPEMFRAACEQLGADPRATLMVGDNPARDGGAAACGLRAYILPGEQRTGDRGLAQVLALLGRPLAARIPDPAG